jgi:diadenosine tetraphosphate (Ap4A) HIT family hydrolase
MHEPGDRYCVGADFCQELSGETADTEFARTYQGDPESRVVYRSDHLTLLADMSPLAVGHLLLASNDHYLSFGEAVGDHLDEINDVIKQTYDQYAATFGEPVIMEHGSSQLMDGSACITHAHMHFLPLRLNAVHTTIVQDGLTASELGDIRDLKYLGDRGLSYFYCGNRVEHRVYGVAHKMRRQYLRSVAGRLLGMADPEWDYAVVVRKAFLRITLSRTANWRIVSY